MVVAYRFSAITAFVVRSLGLVMMLGTACIYLATLLVLRPLLRWRLESLRAGAEAGRELDAEPRRAQDVAPVGQEKD